MSVKIIHFQHMIFLNPLIIVQTQTSEVILSWYGFLLHGRFLLLTSLDRTGAMWTFGT